MKVGNIRDSEIHAQVSQFFQPRETRVQPVLRFFYYLAFFSLQYLLLASIQFITLGQVMFFYHLFHTRFHYSITFHSPFTSST